MFMKKTQERNLWKITQNKLVNWNILNCGQLIQKKIKLTQSSGVTSEWEKEA